MIDNSLHTGDNMNIFYLSDNIEHCAQYHVDKHVVKMILEYAQILCTVCNLKGHDTPYKSTHVKHPCVEWAAKSLDNWRWLRKLTEELNKEYKRRFNKIRNHASYDVVKKLKEPLITTYGITSRPQCMPEILQVPNDPIMAYRLYYLTEKKNLLKWSNGPIPHWVIGGYKVLFPA
jgi:hypothetical protein